MFVSICCPNEDCAHIYKVSQETIGKRVRCRQCGTVFEARDVAAQLREPSDAQALTSCCSYCGAQHATGLKLCPKCGHEAPNLSGASQPSRMAARLPWALAAALALVALVIGWTLGRRDHRGSAPLANPATPAPDVQSSAIADPSGAKRQASAPPDVPPAPVVPAPTRTAARNSSSAKLQFTPCAEKQIRLAWMSIGVLNETGEMIATLEGCYKYWCMRPEDQLTARVVGENTDFYQVKLDCWVYEAQVKELEPTVYVSQDGNQFDLWRRLPADIQSIGQLQEAYRSLGDGKLGEGRGGLRLTYLGDSRALRGWAYRKETIVHPDQTLTTYSVLEPAQPDRATEWPMPPGMSQMPDMRMPDMPSMPKTETVKDPRMLHVQFTGCVSRNFEHAGETIVAAYEPGLFKKTKDYARCASGLGPGVTRADIVRAMGTPSRQGPGAHGNFDVQGAGGLQLEVLQYASKGVTVSLENDKTYGVKAAAKFRGFLHGVRIGDSMETVMRLYGKPNEAPYFSGTDPERLGYIDEGDSLTVYIDPATHKVVGIDAGYAAFRGSWFTIPGIRFGP